jgi:hypothetical protein
MYGFLVQTKTERQEPAAEERRPWNWFRNKLARLALNRSAMDAYWQLTTLPLSLSLSMIVTSMIVRMFRAS